MGIRDNPEGHKDEWVSLRVRVRMGQLDGRQTLCAAGRALRELRPKRVNHRVDECYATDSLSAAQVLGVSLAFAERDGASRTCRGIGWVSDRLLGFDHDRVRNLVVQALVPFSEDHQRIDQPVDIPEQAGRRVDHVHHAHEKTDNDAG